MTTPEQWREGIREIRALPEYDPDKKDSVGMWFANEPGRIVVKIADRTTGRVYDLPDDGVIIIFPNEEVATAIRDDLLDPSEFPEVV